MRIRWFIAFLLFISLAFRFWYFSTHVVVSNDTLRDAQIVEELTRSGNYLPTVGPKASVGNFYLPPLYYQVHLLFSVLSNHHPLTMNVVNTFIEALTPVVVFLLLLKVSSKHFAFILSLLYVFAPLPVIFGTRAWNPITIPFFTSLAVLLWLHFLETKKRYLIPIMVAAVTVALHLHYQSVVVLPFYLICFFWSIKTYPKLLWYWLLGASIAVLSLLPYVVGEAQNQWQNTLAIQNYFSGEHSQYFDRVSKPEYIYTFLPAFFERVLTNSTTQQHWFGRVLGLSAVSCFVLLLKKQPVKWKTQDKYLFLLLSYVISIVIALRLYKGDKIDYYMSTLFTAPLFFLAALSKIHTKAAIAGASILILFAFKTTVAIPQFNDLKELDAVVKTLKQHSTVEGFRYFFYDIRQANTFSYLIYKNPEIKMNQKSSTIVDIFESTATISISPTLCSNSYKEEQSNAERFSQFKCEYDYQPTVPSMKFKDFAIQIGTVTDTNGIEVKHSVDSSHGTDILLTDLF